MTAFYAVNFAMKLSVIELHFKNFSLIKKTLLELTNYD